MNKRLLILIILFTITSTVKSQDHDSQTMVKKTEWIKFSGQTLKKGNQFLLTAPSGDPFTISKNAVKFKKNSVFVKTNSKVNFIQSSIRESKAMSDCNCPPKILATNREEHIPKHGCDTKCFGVILFCIDCVYDPAGVFSKEETKICGGCIGLPF